MSTETLTERSPARAAWEETGTVVVPGVLDEARFEVIQAESLGRLDLATPYIREEATAHRDGSFASPVHCGFLPAGPELERLAYDKQLPAASPPPPSAPSTRPSPVPATTASPATSTSSPPSPPSGAEDGAAWSPPPSSTGSADRAAR